MLKEEQPVAGTVFHIPLWNETVRDGSTKKTRDSGHGGHIEKEVFENAVKKRHCKKAVCRNADTAPIYKEESGAGMKKYGNPGDSVNFSKNG